MDWNGGLRNVEGRRVEWGDRQGCVPVGLSGAGVVGLGFGCSRVVCMPPHSGATGSGAGCSWQRSLDFQLHAAAGERWYSWGRPAAGRPTAVHWGQPFTVA